MDESLDLQSGAPLAEAEEHGGGRRGRKLRREGAQQAAAAAASPVRKEKSSGGHKKAKQKADTQEDAQVPPSPAPDCFILVAPLCDLVHLFSCFVFLPGGGR